MNVFKLLSRATNLSNSPRNASSSQTTPSSGAATDPRLFPNAEYTRVTQEDAAVTLESENRGTKRKRSEIPSTATPDIPDDLDFFSASASKKPVKARDLPTSVAQEQDPSDPLDLANNQTPATALLSTAEAHRLFKAHKVKITTLWGNDTSMKGKRDARKRKKRKDDSKNLKKIREANLDVAVQPMTSFSALRSQYHVASRLVDNIMSQGYTTPTEVQMGSIPLLLDGEGGGLAPTAPNSASCGPRVDLLTVAPTGSGKTLAFLIPTMNAILKQRDISGGKETYHGIQAVILAPTKELASQIVNEARKLAQKTGVKASLMKKGMVLPPSGDEKSFSQADAEPIEIDDDDETTKPNIPITVRAHILVATPLVLLHGLENYEMSATSLSTVRYLVLDEADVLLDPLFREQTLGVWQACTHPHLRMSLWSATMGSSIEDLSKSIIAARSDSDTARAPYVRIVVGMKDSALPTISHRLVYAATEPGKLMALRQLIRPAAPSPDDASPALRPPFLVFTQSIARAKALVSELRYDIPAAAGGTSRIAVLHSELSDTARDGIMTRFRRGEIWVLITTDLLSRGVDFRGINGVVNYDFPSSSAVYVHRVGRTGRAGRAGGVAVTLYTKDDIPFLKSVANVIAASEKMSGADADATSVTTWLLDSLPKVGKKEKQRLKKRGVEVRREDGRATEHDRRRARISTESGYDKRKKDRRRGQTRADIPRAAGAVSASDDDFDGFDD